MNCKLPLQLTEMIHMRHMYKQQFTAELLLIYMRLKAVLSRCKDVAKDQNTRDHLAWIGNGDPMRVSHMG